MTALTRIPKLTEAQRQRIHNGEPVTVTGYCDTCTYRLPTVISDPIRFLPDGHPYGNSYTHLLHPETEGRTWIGMCAWLKDAPFYGDGPRCPRCEQSLRFAPLQARVTDTPCSRDCTEAEGFKCSCICGGLNHGIDA